MSLLEPPYATAFLEQYKRLLSDVAERPLDGITDFEEAREILYEEELNKTHPMGSEYDSVFIEGIRNAQYGMYVYAKKYKQGYALKYENNVWYFVKALTTPLEEMLPDWIVIVTTVLPYSDQYICDGLVVDKHISIGKNMIHDMIQELKIERPKWSSKKRPDRAG